MPKSRSTVIPLADYPTGTATLALGNIANDVSLFQLELARCTTATPTIWPNAATTVSVSVEWSGDNGQTWHNIGGFGAGGGIVPSKVGGEATYSGFQCDVPPGHNRRLRCIATIENGPLRTQGTLELTSP